MKRLFLLLGVVVLLASGAPAHAGTDALEQVATSTTEAPAVADEPIADPEDDGSSSWLVVLMAIIVTAMVVVAVAFVRGRRPPA